MPSATPSSICWQQPEVIADLGRQAHQHVLEAFVGDEHLKRYAYLLDWLSPCNPRMRGPPVESRCRWQLDGGPSALVDRAGFVT